jgi:hypothetical protein
MWQPGELYIELYTTRTARSLELGQEETIVYIQWWTRLYSSSVLKVMAGQSYPAGPLLGNPVLAVPVLPFMFSLSRSACPVLGVLFWLSFYGCPCPGCPPVTAQSSPIVLAAPSRRGSPVPAIRSWNAIAGSSVLIVLSGKSSPGSPSPEILYRQTCSARPIQPVLFCLSCYVCTVLTVLCWLSFPGYPFLVLGVRV